MQWNAIASIAFIHYNITSRIVNTLVVCSCSNVHSNAEIGINLRCLYITAHLIFSIQHTIPRCLCSIVFLVFNKIAPTYHKPARLIVYIISFIVPNQAVWWEVVMRSCNISCTHTHTHGQQCCPTCTGNGTILWFENMVLCMCIEYILEIIIIIMIEWSELVFTLVLSPYT